MDFVYRNQKSGSAFVYADTHYTPGAGDATAPTFLGTLSQAHTSTTMTVSWSACTSSDNVAVARREYRIGGSGGYTAATTGEEASKTHTFVGLTPSTPYQIQVRCVDTSGNVSLPLSVVASTSAASVDDGMNHIAYRLTTRDGVPYDDLVNLTWAIFAELSPGLFNAPVAKGSIATLPGVADLNIALDSAIAPAGWYMLVLADADNTATVASPVLVS